MKPRHYINENDPYAAAWIKNLIMAGELPSADVDERSIVDVAASDLEGYVQCHFFAGIGGWPLALKLAGWPDDRPVWTGSCPCQPFSGAGKQQGEKDKRHLWPDFLRLIVEWEVPAIFGEQVASRLGREWLTGVCADLEALDYVVGAADLCAAGAGAPHIRQRLYWVADAGSGSVRGRPEHRGDAGATEDLRGEVREQRLRTDAGSDGGTGGLADGNGGRQPQLAQRNSQSIDGIEAPCRHDIVGRSAAGGLGDTSSQGLAQRSLAADGQRTVRHERPTTATTDFESAWSRYDVVHCSDGKARRTEPTIFPLAYAGEWGLGSRVGILRGAGNAIVPQVAKTFIEAYLDIVK